LPAVVVAACPRARLRRRLAVVLFRAGQPRLARRVVGHWHVPGLEFALLAATALFKKHYAQGAQLCIRLFALYVLLNRR
jgi:hypothetical protein